MTLVDSSVLLDMFAGSPEWASWSKQQLNDAASRGPVIINDVIYTEISVRFGTHQEIDSVLHDIRIEVVTMPRAALFLAGKVFSRYRAAGGIRTGVLSDFFIGAHANVGRLPLLTRDPKRIRNYFPEVELIAPGTAGA